MSGDIVIMSSMVRELAETGWGLVMDIMRAAEHAEFGIVVRALGRQPPRLLPFGRLRLARQRFVWDRWEQEFGPLSLPRP